MRARGLHFLAVFFFTIPVAGQNTITSPQLIEDRPTLTTIGFQLIHSGDANRNATVTFQYRRQGDAVWLNALPMLRVLPETVGGRVVPNQFAGSIFDLRPATTYEVRVQIQDPDGPVNSTLTAASTTRPVPPASPAAQRQVSVTTTAALQTALGSAQPGDVITLQSGTYSIQWLSTTASGTAANPIIVRGASQSGVIIDGGNCVDCNIIEIYGSYFFLENLTIRNGFQALRFQGASAQGNVLRRVVIQNVANGVNGRGSQRDFYIADNVIQGRLAFPFTYDSDNGASSDGYSIALHGSGHVVAHNQISGFANGITMPPQGNRAIDIYGNEITYSYDDAIELDGSEGNVRAFRNRLTNTYVGFSFQPILGGPAYVFRNTSLNSKYTPLKFHSRAATPQQDPSGVLVYHNTFVSTVRPLNMGSPLPNHNSTLMNNIFLGPVPPQNGLAGDWVAPLDRVTFDYNGYFPDGTFFFRNSQATANVASFAALFPTFALEQHGRVLSASTLANGLLGPAAYDVFQSPQDMNLGSNSLALDAGAALANINDSFTGAAPDLGALERGCATPAYGPRPSGIDETTPAAGCTTVTTNSPPNPSSISPISQSGPRAIFSLTATDSNGWQDITKLSLQFEGECTIELDRAARQMYLWNDAGNARLGPITVGTPTTLRNSTCIVSGKNGSVVETDTPNEVRWNVYFIFSAGRYGVVKTVHAKADDAVSSSGWKLMGTWR